MKTFPFEANSFAYEDTIPPLWRPSAGGTYFIPFTECVQIWTGDDVDERRFRAGQVYKRLSEATRAGRWLTGMGKLRAYSRAFEVSGQPNLFRLEPLGNRLVVCEDGRPSTLPTFTSRELATLALESLSETEHRALVGG